MVTGVAIRNNKGVGVWALGSVENYILNNNIVNGNGMGMLLQGTPTTPNLPILLSLYYSSPSVLSILPLHGCHTIPLTPRGCMSQYHHPNTVIPIPSSPLSTSFFVFVFLLSSR